MLASCLLVLKNVALLVLVIYGASQVKYFYQLFLPTSDSQSKSYIAIFFGMLGLLGATFSASLMGHDLINLDFFPVIIGGLAAGPLVGLGASLITASPYLLKSDYLSMANGIILVLGGVTGGLLANSGEVGALVEGYSSRISNFFTSQLFERRTAGRFSKYIVYFFITSVIICSKTVFALHFTDVSLHITLSQFIWGGLLIHVIIVTGVILAMRIMENLLSREEYIVARQSHTTLRIANETLQHLRDGLTAESASTTANVILEIVNASAVAITDTKHILAYAGLGADHHRVGGDLLTKSTKDVLAIGELQIIKDRKGIGCPCPGCPLNSAIIIPLKSREKIIGTLKLYLGENLQLTPEFTSLASGLGRILSIQIELAEVARLEQLTTQAELKALQAQINPHFLFNTLNTIASFSRTKPEVARELLIKFADFFRRGFNQPKEFITLKEELEYIDAYLMFEKARFGDRLSIEKELEEGALNSLLPALILQPIVENAIKHGISTDDTSRIHIMAKRNNGELELMVKDEGQGIPPSELKKIFTMGYGEGNGVGLSNVNERLKAIYGENFSVKISSRHHKGTTVLIKIPQRLN